MSRSRLSATDLCFWDLDSGTTRQAIALFCWLKSTPDIALLREHFARAVAQFPDARASASDSRGQAWVPTRDFAISRHVYQENLGESAGPDAILARAEEVFSAGFDLSRAPEMPLWKCVVFSIESAIKLKSRRGARETFPAAALCMIHHSLADGQSTLSFLYAAFTSASQKGEALRQTNSTAARLRRSPSWQEGRNTLYGIRGLARDLRQSRPVAMLNGANSAGRRFSQMSIPLEALQRLKRHYSLSLNEQAIAIITYGLRLYAQRAQNEAVDLCALIPVNIRENAREATLGNHLGAVPLLLPCSSADPQQIAALVRTRLQQRRESGAFYAFTALARVLKFLPRSLRRQALKALARRVNFILTSVFGPQEKLFIGGAEVLESYGVPALMHDQGLGVAVMRYDDKVFISLVSDPNIIKAPHQLVECIAEAMMVFEDRTSSAQPLIGVAR